MMDFQKDTAEVPDDAVAAIEPLTKNGLSADEIRYMQGDAQPAAPSIINTNSIYLNNPYYRDVYTQIALRRNGPDVPSTYIIPMAGKAIGEVTDYAHFAQCIEEEKEKNPEFRDWLKARRHTIYHVEDVAHYAPGTLGHAIWEFLTQTGFQMDALQMAHTKVTNDIDYISQRRGGLHDIEHMITGFGPNNCGETALVWCNIASLVNYFSPDLGHYMSAGLTFLNTAQLQAKSLHYRAVFPIALEAAQLGIAMGRALKRPLIMEPIEDMLDWPLEKIRTYLGITEGPGAAWDWTTEASTG